MWLKNFRFMWIISAIWEQSNSFICPPLLPLSLPFFSFFYGCFPKNNPSSHSSFPSFLFSSTMTIPISGPFGFCFVLFSFLSGNFSLLFIYAHPVFIHVCHVMSCHVMLIVSLPWIYFSWESGLVWLTSVFLYRTHNKC